MRYRSLAFLALVALAPESLPSQDKPKVTPRAAAETSIVDYLKSQKRDSDFGPRKKLYEERFGRGDYAGTAAQNTWLLLVLQDEAAKMVKDKAAAEAWSIQHKASICAIDKAAVVLAGAEKLEAFDALPKDKLRIAKITKGAPQDAGAPRYFVVISARKTQLHKKTIGHAWIALGILGAEKEDAGKCVGQAFGMFPLPEENAAQSYFKAIPGTVVLGWMENSNNNMDEEIVRFVVEVSQEGYRSAWKSLNARSSKGEYKLLESDCVTLAEDVARSVGLTVPQRELKTPGEAVESIIRANLPPTPQEPRKKNPK